MSTPCAASTQPRACASTLLITESNPLLVQALADATLTIERGEMSEPIPALPDSGRAGESNAAGIAPLARPEG